jgi:hypothetical protein
MVSNGTGGGTGGKSSKKYPGTVDGTAYARRKGFKALVYYLNEP